MEWSINVPLNLQQGRWNQITQLVAVNHGSYSSRWTRRPSGPMRLFLPPTAGDITRTWLLRDLRSDSWILECGLTSRSVRKVGSAQPGAVPGLSLTAECTVETNWLCVTISLFR